MQPETFLPILNARPFDPQPRHDSTVELDLSSMLSTEQEAARDQENLAAVRAFISSAYLTT